MYSNLKASLSYVTRTHLKNRKGCSCSLVVVLPCNMHSLGFDPLNSLQWGIGSYDWSLNYDRTEVIDVFGFIYEGIILIGRERVAWLFLGSIKLSMFNSSKG